MSIDINMISTSDDRILNELQLDVMLKSTSGADKDYVRHLRAVIRYWTWNTFHAHSLHYFDFAQLYLRKV